MIKAKHKVRVPPITRVHNLYRLRFTVNEINKLSPATAISFERSLTEYQLSKFSKLHARDRQGRRSRDHLAVCTYLGLLNRKLIHNEFYYSVTPLGQLLTDYDFREECPKDLSENVVFTLALTRLKYTNAHYEHPMFEAFRYRPITIILHALNLFPMRIEQIYFLLGSIKNEEELFSSKGKRLFQFLFDPEYRTLHGEQKFCKKAGLTKDDIKELDRSVKPLLTWCQQLGLINEDQNSIYQILDRGKTVLEFSKKYFPIWFNDLGSQAKKKAALLLLLIACHIEHKKINQEFLNSTLQLEEELSLEKITNRNLLKTLSKKYSIFNSTGYDFGRDCQLAFDFYVDVPPINQDAVSRYFEKGKSLLGLAVTMEDVSKHPFYELKDLLQTSTDEIELSRVSQLLNIVMPRRELFQVSFEHESCIALRLLRFNANKYQRQFEELVSPTLQNTAKNNPDLLVVNDVAYLVECKSKEEWNENLSFTKEVRREIVNYQDYCEGVNSNCALLLVESEFVKDNFYLQLLDTLKLKNRVVFCSYPYLLACAKDEDKRKRMKVVCDSPHLALPEHKILFEKYVQPKSEIF